MLFRSPLSLEDISIRLNTGLAKQTRNTSRVIVHSLSTLLLYNDLSKVFKFVGFIGSKLKTSDTTIIYLVDRDIHSVQVLNTLRHLCDYTMELTERDSHLMLSIGGVTMLPVEVEIEIGGNGIQLA